MSDTVYALSSAPGKAGVAVVRVSGPAALNSFKLLINKDKLPVFRMADLVNLYDPADGSLIDKALAIAFEAPGSFTGENVVEYHLHGSPAVLESLFRIFSALPDHRMAEPGEFTRRAFENGKMDLTEAEAIADLIDAETQAQKQQALEQMGGALSSLYQGWADRLVKILAYTEAVIDFPDEDVPDDEINKARPQVEELAAEIHDHLNDNRRGERLRDGIRVAVIGAPNAGKSSLVNLLAQRDVAIVSDMAGTTRDVIDVHLNIGGYPVILSDTAGLRPDQLGSGDHDRIESEGIRRAIQKAEEADIRLLVFDAEDEKYDSHTLNLINSDSIAVINKCDLFHVKQEWKHEIPRVALSVQNGDGVDELLIALENRISALLNVSRETPSLTRQRHRDQLTKTLDALEGALSASVPELMAEDLRLAIRALGRITGRVDVEDLLDVIFRDFCIGK